ncbi:MAG: FAD-dependent oxidoreductase [Gammaproteobacteria bacterium]|nr:FAD-dependent oxidoreductase [Gammaproteobacteria bacterium]
MARTPLLQSLRKFIRTAYAARAHSVAAPVRTSKHSVTRRDFLAGLGALTATAALPGGVDASPRNARIAIAGGGIAGLTCALMLADRGIRSTVYEASGRVGGRMFSNTGYWAEGQVSEWCGELIDSGHKTIQRLAHRFGLVLDNLLDAQPAGSEDTYYFFGRYYPKAQADHDFALLVDAVMADLEAAGYPTTFDAFTPAGKILDQMSVYDWIETRVPGGHTSTLGLLLDTAYAIEYGADTTDQSALNLIYLLGFQPAPSGFAVFGESDEAFHIRGGNEQLPRAIARHLGDESIELGKRLVRIEQTERGDYRLTFKELSEKTEEVCADYVVLALPFSVLREVDISRAGFDTLKRQAIEQLGCGRSAKTQLQFNTRLWNETGTWPGVSNGSTYSDTGYQSSWEVTRAQDGTGGVINFFSGGSVAASMSSTSAFATASNQKARADAQTALQRAEIVYPGLSAQWNGKLTQSLPHLNPLMRASYAYYRVGQYTAFGGYEGVRQNGVLFCGDHTSQDFQGFMEGAASEGRRAGRELAKLLR